MERARSEGLDVAMVVVADDVALPEGKGITGGRGVAYEIHTGTTTQVIFDCVFV